ncbi:carboxypeptidase M32 [Rhodopila sp.]|uniref:carboxypeptidase M32 n=1 Tax=Rhodopila sp. TaxID=2480087 RepID=UPI003D132A62
MTPYDRLAERFRRIALIGECASLLGWDASAVMPLGGGPARGDQLALLAGLGHQHLTAPEIEQDLAAAETADPGGDPGGDPWDNANLRLMRHAYVRAKAVPEDLVVAQAKANATCEKVWRIARQSADFAQVAPYLAEVVHLTRETAANLAPALGLSPYDALMDGYQPGIRAEDVAPVFAAYEAFLATALPEAEARQARQAEPVRPAGRFPVAAQESLCRSIAERLGLNFNHARLDQSAHPFSGGTPTDVRITTRYDEADFAGALMGVIHETGHALYEQGLPTRYARLPVGEAAGMAMHESQSLIFEMQACRSDVFLGWMGGRLRDAFGGDPAPYRPENLGRALRRVRRSFIRVDADEMTYPAHVILRFRLERALIDGQLSVRDLPGAWNEALQALLGITPPDDAQGCLQDIHWYDGAFGYFPSYTLGAMAAAQLMMAARAQVDALDDALGQGNLSPLLGWLRQHVHSVGSRLTFNEILQQSTGRVLDPSAFQAHLRKRYLE